MSAISSISVITHSIEGNNRFRTNYEVYYQINITYSERDNIEFTDQLEFKIFLVRDDFFHKTDLDRSLANRAPMAFTFSEFLGKDFGRWDYFPLVHEKYLHHWTDANHFISQETIFQPMIDLKKAMSRFKLNLNDLLFRD